MKNGIVKFTELDSEKKERIINATMIEFATNGYAKTATDDIVKRAMISKGALFYYFKDKNTLYLYIYDYALGVAMEEFYNKIDYREPDILKRIRQAINAKIAMVNKYPSITEFLRSANREETEVIKAELERRNNKFINEHYEKLTGKIDRSLFKDHLDPDLAIDIIIWMMRGYKERSKQQSECGSQSDKDYTQKSAEIDRYLEIFRTCFYR